MGKSILQDWVTNLGIKHQGVLISAVRGCDTANKFDASKEVVRYMRSAILNAHCGDASKAKSFIEVPKDENSFLNAMRRYFREYDSLPTHYVIHLAHAAEIIGYHHPGLNRDTSSKIEDIHGFMWLDFYRTFCDKLHLNVETKEQLDRRLNADEDTFGAAQ